MLLLAAKSNFPLTWYGPIGLIAAAWFLGAFIFTYIRGVAYGGRKPDGGYKRYTREENPKEFRFWLGVLAVCCLVLAAYGIFAYVSNPPRW